MADHSSLKREAISQILIKIQCQDIQWCSYSFWGFEEDVMVL